MHEIELGFRLDGRLIPWGTTLPNAAEEAGRAFTGDGAIGYRHHRVGCRRAYGFDTLAAEMSAPGGDRPVTALAYDLALPDDGSMDPAIWTGAIGHALGKPDTEQRENVPSGAHASGSVKYYANWARGDVSVGLSIFGAPRQVAEGMSAGTLWLSWSHVQAAIPYLASWRAACAALAVAARGAEDVWVFALEVDQSPSHGAKGRGHELKRASELALSAPDLLDTPLEIASRLTPKSLAIWRNPAQKLACLSSRFDSIMWDDGSPIEIVHQVTKPAKGGGRSGLHLRRFSVVDVFGSTGIEAAATALASMPAVTVRREEDYDC